MTLWSTYWTARSTSTLSTPILSNCRQAIVPVASCSSVWSILRPTSSPGSSEPLTMWSLRILATRFSAIAHHPRGTSSLSPHSTQPDEAPTPAGSGRRPRGNLRRSPPRPPPPLPRKPRAAWWRPLWSVLRRRRTPVWRRECRPTPRPERRTQQRAERGTHVTAPHRTSMSPADQADAYGHRLGYAIHQGTHGDRRRSSLPSLGSLAVLGASAHR